MSRFGFWCLKLEHKVKIRCDLEVDCSWLKHSIAAEKKCKCAYKAKWNFSMRQLPLAVVAQGTGPADPQVCFDVAVLRLRAFINPLVSTRYEKTPP